ncbi:MAG TPA: type II toxin-antitoxin system VapC family toxin, partial [Isosphaeraceae bacterium]
MIGYILDTDTLSLLAYGHPSVRLAVDARRPSELAITVISVEEQLTGWYTLLRQVRSAQDEADVYLRLTSTVRTLSDLQIVTYSVPAIERFGRLLAMKLNVGKKDLRIAAIALEEGAVVVTRNERDFRRVPGL